jgi:hypothetical protein
MEYSIISSSKGTTELIIIIVLVISFIIVLLVGLMFIGFINASKNSKVLIQNNMLSIKSFIYSKNIQIDAIQKNKIEKINLTKDNPLSPKIRINGVGLPGYYLAGWFKLNNGNKAFLQVTRKNDVLYIPTNQGYDLLLSVQNPDQFIAELSK